MPDNTREMLTMFEKKLKFVKVTSERGKLLGGFCSQKENLGTRPEKKNKNGVFAKSYSFAIQFKILSLHWKHFNPKLIRPEIGSFTEHSSDDF